MQSTQNSSFSNLLTVNGNPLGRAIPVVTPTLCWPTRQEASEECRVILRESGYALGDKIDDPRHEAVLMALVSIHQDSAAKTGVGISEFFIGDNEQAEASPGGANSTAIWIRWNDGETTDFGYTEAIYPSDAAKKVEDALRAAARQDIRDFRDSRFARGQTTVSDLSGAPFPERAAANVVFIRPTFAQMSFRFAEMEGGYDAIELVEKQKYIGDGLADPAARMRWLEFFRTYADPKLYTKSESARRSKTRDVTGWTP
jgi:hypothetical protein